MQQTLGSCQAVSLTLLVPAAALAAARLGLWRVIAVGGLVAAGHVLKALSSWLLSSWLVQVRGRPRGAQLCLPGRTDC